MLPSLPILLDQTVGGAVSTGSHGSSLRHGTMSDAVVGVTAVLLCDGSVVVCDERDGEGLANEEEAEVGWTAEQGGDVNKGGDGDGDGGGDGGTRTANWLTGSTTSAALRLLRCSLGEAAVLCEVSLQVEPQRCFVRREVPLLRIAAGRTPNIMVEVDRMIGDLTKILNDEANQHVWVQWRLGGGAVAICLREPGLDPGSGEDGNEGQHYDGRNWFPFSPELQNLTAPLSPNTAAAKREGKEDKESKENTERGNDDMGQFYTFQYSVQMALLTELVHAVLSVEQLYLGCVVELKFLQSSSRTLFAPNSTALPSAVICAKKTLLDEEKAREACMDGGVVCLNVWWKCSSTSEFEAMEAALMSVRGARPHYGKWHDEGQRPTIREVAVLREITEGPSFRERGREKHTLRSLRIRNENRVID